MQGTKYKFRVESRNVVGYSPYSGEIEILTAIVPASPNMPVTTNSANNVILTFTSPTSNSNMDYGSPISRYYIYFLDTLGSTWSEEPTDCSGDDATIMSTLSCTIPVSTFLAAPFNLNAG